MIAPLNQHTCQSVQACVDETSQRSTDFTLAFTESPFVHRLKKKQKTEKPSSISYLGLLCLGVPAHSGACSESRLPPMELLITSVRPHRERNEKQTEVGRRVLRGHKEGCRELILRFHTFVRSYLLTRAPHKQTLASVTMETAVVTPISVCTVLLLLPAAARPLSWFLTLSNALT